MVDLHSEWFERAARCVVADRPGRHSQLIKLLAVERDDHSLGGFVDLDQKVGVCGLADHERRDAGGDPSEETADAH